MMMQPAQMIAPFAAWMTLMALLPASGAVPYAVRGAVTAVLLVWALFPFRALLRPSVRDVVWGVAAGLLVLALWVLPEQSGFYARYFILSASSPAVEGSVYDPAVCGWPLSLARLLASAFVISVAEELFFRKWLYDFAGFWWSTALFALGHDRYLAGALAGAVYALVRSKVSLKSAAIAHITTNLALGALVLLFGWWHFW